MQVIRNLVTFDALDGQVAAFGLIFRHETTCCVPREMLIASLSLSSSMAPFPTRIYMDILHFEVGPSSSQ